MTGKEFQRRGMRETNVCKSWTLILQLHTMHMERLK